MQEMAFQGLYISKFSRESMPPALLQVSRAFGAPPPQKKTKLYAYDQCSKSVELVDPIHITSGHNGRKIECPTCHGHFLTEEIGFHADLCAENAHRVAFFLHNRIPTPR